jgi:peptidoglycan/xylan/chitin deacetylase (PgdA/CDA1 family)
MYLSKKRILLILLAIVLIIIICIVAVNGRGDGIKPEEKQSPPVKGILDPVASGAILKINTDERVVALTIEVNDTEDDYTAEIIDVLNRHGVEATFFLTGQWVENNPNMAQVIVESGYAIGNHSYAHEDISGLSARKIAQDIEKADSAIGAIYSEEINLYRSPYACVNKNVFKACKNKNKLLIIHSLDSLDWQSAEAQSAVNNVISAVAAGDIIAFHNDAACAPQALDEIIRQMRKTGYRFVTVHNLLSVGAE